MDIGLFIKENYVIVIIVIVAVMTIIGYFAQKTEFGKKVSENNKKNKEKNLPLENNNINDNVEFLNENVTNDSVDFSNQSLEMVPEQVDILDTLAPNFNNGGLVINDVNQNPNTTNEELGISEDLYAPFGDTLDNDQSSFDGLKIEDVSDVDDFDIVEKNNFQNPENIENAEKIDDSTFHDINQSLEITPNFAIDDLKIEDVSSDGVDSKNLDMTNTIDEVVQPEIADQIKEEISDLVDNTFVINDGTNDFVDLNTGKENIENNDFTDNVSKVEQFSIDDNEMSLEEPNELEIETTTTLKLDEINEKIKNLKLEDLDNPNLENELIADVKKIKKRKPISVKSVDEIKESSNENNLNITNEVDNLNAEVENQEMDVVEEMTLPDLDMVNENNEKSDDDDIWNF